MKQLADELEISILLVHHLRKQGDGDRLIKFPVQQESAERWTQFLCLTKANGIQIRQRSFVRAEILNTVKWRWNCQKKIVFGLSFQTALKIRRCRLPDEMVSLIDLWKSKNPLTERTVNSQNFLIRTTAKGCPQKVLSRWWTAGGIRLKNRACSLQTAEATGKGLWIFLILLPVTKVP